MQDKISGSALNRTDTKGSGNCTDTARLIITDKIHALFKGQCQRILLVLPHQFTTELLNVKNAKNKRYYNYPPYGLGLLCTNLKKRGYEVSLLDLNMEILAFIHREKDGESIKMGISPLWKERIKEGLGKFQPDIVGITCMFTMSHKTTIQIADFIKSCNQNMPIVAGGVHVTNAPEIILKEGKSIDFVSLYEGDESFCDFVDFVNNKVSPGILSQLGTVVDNQYYSLKEHHVPTQESINFTPDYLDLDIRNYIDLGEMGNFRYWIPKDARVSAVLSNRGCRGRCSFCSVRNFNGPGVRSRSVESVIDEIEELREKRGINHITWLDDDLFYNPKRTVQLFNEIVKRNLKITWDAMNGIIASAVANHPETMHSAAESGCIAVNFGVESGNPEILRMVHKPSSINNYLKVGEIMRKYPQIYARNFIIFGFPGETFRQMLDTVKVAKAMGMDWNGVQRLTLLPSTEMYDQMVHDGLIKDGSLTLNKKESTLFSVRQTEKQRLREANEQQSADEFVNLFEGDLDDIPANEKLDDLWFLIDYMVNYEKILTEENPLRLKKMQCFLRDVTTRMTMDNPLATLFLGIVESKLGNLHEAEVNTSLSKSYLKKSAYWQIRFKILDLERLYNLSAVFNVKGCNDYY